MKRVYLLRRLFFLKYILAAATLSLMGCGNYKFSVNTDDSASNLKQETPPTKDPGNHAGNTTDPSPTTPTNPATPPAVNPPAPPVSIVYKPLPLSWESPSRPAAKTWSEYAFKIVRENAFDVLDKAKDVQTFCPRYDSLSVDQKVNFWGGLFSAISLYESDYDPTSRMQETTMGKDPITGQPVYSEGLLQLSYQDIQWAPYCEFDWSKDKNLSATDPKKTILDPYINLKCGILIMADQIKRKNNIVLSSGVYWAVLKQGGKYQHINDIADITRKLDFCVH